MNNFQDPNLTEKDINDIYSSIAKDSKDRSKGIDYDAFLKKAM